jgi:hypothetical protein
MINSSTWLRERLTGSIVEVTLVPEHVTVLCAVPGSALLSHRTRGVAIERMGESSGCD